MQDFIAHLVSQLSLTLVHKFDAVASLSHWGIPDVLPAQLQDELKTHYAALQCIRQVMCEGCFDHLQLLAIFWTAYLMLLADDGNNLAQLNTMELLLLP